MAVFKKKPKEEEPAPQETPKAAPRESREKFEHECVVEGCYNVKAPGQTYVCHEHVRSN